MLNRNAMELMSLVADRLESVRTFSRPGDTYHQSACVEFADLFRRLSWHRANSDAWGTAAARLAELYDELVAKIKTLKPGD